MNNPHQIHIFISHSWKYTNHYKTLAGWIFDKEWKVSGVPIQFLDYSVPRDNPIHYAHTAEKLQQAIYDKIIDSHVIVIPTGMYVNYSKWIQKEIYGANLYKKPILAVNPWGQEKKSEVVQENASKSVGWNEQSVINAIWSLFNNGK